MTQLARPLIAIGLSLIYTAPLRAENSITQRKVTNGEIYFSCNESGSYQIMAISPDGRNQRPVTVKERDQLVRASHPALSPNGLSVAFSGYAGDRGDVYVINSDGTGLRRLTSSKAGEYQVIPSFSPDGKWLAYESNLGEAPSSPSYLRIIGTDGNNDRRLTPSPAGSYEDMGPKYSPSGDVILFASDRSNARGHHDLYTIRPDGTDLKRITYGVNNSFSRSWSPDGKKIVFNSQIKLSNENAGYGELRMIDADGRHPQRLTNYKRNLGFVPFIPSPGNPPVLRGDVTPGWSPDGKSIAFCGQAHPKGQYELFTINLKTKRRTQITHSPSGVNHVSLGWSGLPEME